MELIKRRVNDRNGKVDDDGNPIQYNNFFVVAEIDGKKVKVMVKPVFSQDTKILSILAKLDSNKEDK